MKRPETAAYVAKARQLLKEARIVAANELPGAAGRAAYLAAFHAAQAFVFDATGRAARWHVAEKAGYWPETPVSTGINGPSLP